MLDTLGKWLRAECILLLVTFFQLLAGFLLLRQEYALLLAVVIALIDALPVFGTGTVLLPWAAVLFVQGRVHRCIALGERSAGFGGAGGGGDRARGHRAGGAVRRHRRGTQRA